MLEPTSCDEISGAEQNAERAAIGLQAGVAARPEQGRGVDRGGFEAGAVARVGEEVEDHRGGVGVDAVGAVPLMLPIVSKLRLPMVGVVPIWYHAAAM